MLTLIEDTRVRCGENDSLLTVKISENQDIDFYYLYRVLAVLIVKLPKHEPSAVVS